MYMYRIVYVPIPERQARLQITEVLDVGNDAYKYDYASHLSFSNEREAGLYAIRLAQAHRKEYVGKFKNESGILDFDW
jgi:hypothetical protein